MSKSIDCLPFYQLDSYFPREEYGKDPSLILHYLIKDGNSRAIEWINKHAAQKKPLDNQEKTTDFTPLHLAAIKSNAAALKALLDGGADMYRIDKKGWTAYDHAFVAGNQQLLHVFAEKKYDPFHGEDKPVPHISYQKSVHATLCELLSDSVCQNPPQDIDASLPEPIKTESVVFHYLSDGEIKQGDKEKFKEITGSTFTPHFLATREFLIHDHMRTLLPEKFPLQAIIDYYRNIYLESYAAPPVYLAPSECGAGKKIGIGLRALENIPKGTLLLPYIGMKDIPSHAQINTDYLFEDTDAAKNRSLAACVQDSFPNSFVLSVHHVDGFNSINVLIAGKDIQKGEELTYNYGNGHSIKTDLHIELKQAESERYFKEFPLRWFRDNYSRLTDSSFLSNGIHAEQMEEIVEITLHLSRLQYLFHTPSSMAYLALKGIVNIQDATLLLREPIFLQIVSPTNPQLLIEKMIPFLVQLEDILEGLHRLDTDQEEVKRFLFELLENYTFSSWTQVIAKMGLLPPNEWCRSQQALRVRAFVFDQFLYAVCTQRKIEEEVIVAQLKSLNKTEGLSIMRSTYWLVKSSSNTTTPLLNKCRAIAKRCKLGKIE